MMGETPFCLERRWAVSPLALENIERMALNSIGCSLERITLYNTGLINILPKLRIHGDCEIERLGLTASEEAHVAGILKQEKHFCVGRVKTIWLKDYAVGVITKMSLKDCEIERLGLTASEEAHVAAVIAQEKPFCVGRVESMWLKDYAVGVITKMSLKDCEFEKLGLTAREEAHVAAVLAQEKPFCVGRVKNMRLWDYAVGVITKMSLKDCEIEYLRLTAREEAHVAEVLKQEKPFCVGRVESMWLKDYAASVITKMTTHEDNTMGIFILDGNEDQLSRILEEGDNSIDLGRIRTGGLHVPEKIKRKLRYTLVDGEGKEVLGEEEPLCVGRVEAMVLREYAVSFITKMNLGDCEIEHLGLTAREEAYVAAVTQWKPVCVGRRVEGMWRKDYAVGDITKMSLKDCEIKYLHLTASEEAHVAVVLAQEKPFCVGRVKNMFLEGYAVGVITKMKIHEDNTMESFVLAGNEDQLSRILEEGDNSIDLGRIRTGGLVYVPEKIKR
ncbi:MAG: uncharacterized protein A8A55_3123, partial [Amphiamblys sp. WSBS2006]